MSASVLLVAVVAAAAAAAASTGLATLAAATTPPHTVADVVGFRQVATHGTSRLLEAELKAAAGSQAVGGQHLMTMEPMEPQQQQPSYGGDSPIQVAVFRGSHREIGAAVGALTGAAAHAGLQALLAALLPEVVEQMAIDVFLDWQWDSYLSRQLPAEFAEELAAVDAGAAHWGLPPPALSVVMKRGLALSNLPGDPLNNIEWLLEREAVSSSFSAAYQRRAADYLQQKKKEFVAAVGGEGLDGVSAAALPTPAELERVLREQVDWAKLHRSCSHMAAWGNRTGGQGQLFAFRNLDWAANTGLNKHKLVAVYHPTGETPHITIGYAGLLGALAGVSRDGIVTTESGNNVRAESFLGETWTLRLRHVMAKASNLDQTLDLWRATNNTVGIFHTVAAAADAWAKKPVAANTLECMADKTAFFADDDPREAAYKTKDGVHLGRPLKEAVWRTNHGYDPDIVASETKAPTRRDSDSVNRYFIISDTLSYYESAGRPVGWKENLNITAILGDKGGSSTSSFYHCPTNSNIGNNVLSVAFNPNADAGKAGTGTMWAAWEIGHGATRRNACCGIYARFDTETLFNL